MQPSCSPSFASSRLLLRITFTGSALGLLRPGRPNLATLAAALRSTAAALLLSLLGIRFALLAGLALLHRNRCFCVDFRFLVEHGLDEGEVLDVLRLFANVAGLPLRTGN